jgi:hypothetical protein
MEGLMTEAARLRRTSPAELTQRESQVLLLLLVADWMHDPTGDNLWRLVFIPVALLLFLYSAAVVVLRWRVARPQPFGSWPTGDLAELQ